MRTDFEHFQRLPGLRDAAAVHARLMEAWQEPQRAYHALQHLAECLGWLDRVQEEVQMPNRDAVELALWFHDAVYDPRAADNEERSAEMACECLDATLANEVRRMILVTRTHRAECEDELWMVDIDLAILGAERSRFDEFERQIRAEYAWVPEALYREKRAEILRGFLERGKLFQTAFFRERLEDRARENLRRLIESLA
ncbi:MAG: hypothetical protein IPK32_13165 [Verrucomicrobiaceae bacterium]|nr:hypothetical protein [Verrucomicrobiaceae bacterium]